MYSGAARLVRAATGAGMRAADEKELAGGEERVYASRRGRKTIGKESQGGKSQRLRRADQRCSEAEEPLKRKGEDIESAQMERESSQRALQLHFMGKQR